MAYFHFGVIRALIESKNMPTILSGASGGAMVSAWIAVRTDQEVLEELNDRNLNVGGNVKEAERLLEDIYYKRVTNKDFSAELDRYFYLVLGRIAYGRFCYCFGCLVMQQRN